MHITEGNMFGLGVVSLILVILIIALFASAIHALLIIVPFWKIFSKVGLSGWLSILCIIPIAHIIVLFYLAFSELPIEKELKALKKNAIGTQQQ